MDPTCGLVDKIRDLVFNLIWKQLRYLVHYHRNIEQLDRKLEDLNCERSALQHRIDDARNNTKEIEANVLHWLDEVEKISKQVHQLRIKSEEKLECGITSCPNPWLRYKLSKRAETIAQEVVEIAKRSFVNVGYYLPLPSMPETNKEGNEGIDSRVGIKNHVMEALQNSRFNMIGLCGLGGVGKTTIAKDIGKEVKNQKVFEKVIMATIPQEMNIGKIQDQIIEKLGMQLNEKTEEGKAYRLKERLKKEENILLILDDLWQELDLGKVGIPFVDVERYSQIKEGCKILLTSRKETLLSKDMKCQKIFKVGILSEDEAWELFQSIAELSIASSNPDLKSVATEIVQKCGGLPLAIAAAAKALKNKNIAGWRDFLSRLKHPLARSVTGIKEVDNILKSSYEDISQENQYIFLLSAMLSHDPSIEDLLMYSVGLDILKHPQNMGDAHDAIFEIVGKLKSLNLFLDSFSSHHFTIHDVVRDFALSIASKELNAVIVRHSRLNEWPDESDLECRKGIYLQDICDLPGELHGPILEFFLLNSKKDYLTIPNMFFKSSKKLKVLAITNVRCLSLPSLSFLQRLKALCLHSCLLEDITEIRSLSKLKVLSLAYSEIQRLPIEVAELTSLQMLNLSHCSKLKVIPQKLLCSLKKLEVLFMENSFNQWKVEESSKSDRNASLDELMDLPISSLEIHIPNLSMLPENLFLTMNLRRYRIFIGERWTWKSNYGASKILKIELKSSINLTAGLQFLSKGVEDLHLYGSNGQENVLYNFDASGFPCLKHLRIQSNDDIKYIVLNSAHHEDAFPILESLKLKNVKALENLCEGPNDIVFRQLRTLKMENLPGFTGDFNIKDRATKIASNNIFKSLFNKVLHNSFNNLKILRVENWGFVKLVPLHVMKSLNNLEEVEVRYCYMLEIVFDFEDWNYKEMESSSVVMPLKKLMLWNLPKLKNMWSHHYQGNVSFPSLRSVCVYECESLRSIFPVSIAKGMLCDLEELKICRCGVDVIVAKDQVSESVAVTFGFPKLTSLVLSGLPNLRNFYPKKHTLEWPHLSELSICCCDELEIFEKEVSGSSEIYEEENMLDSKYPLLPHDKVLHNSFNNLKILRVEKCGLVKLVTLHVLKSLHNLEEVQVGDCDMLEIVFDFEDLNYKEMESSSVVMPLKKLMLWKLPKLKNVWSDHYQGNVSFPSLRSVCVYECESLTSIFPASIAKGMLCDLEELKICQCGVDVIVAKDQVSESVSVTFGFPKLTSLLLYGLPNLRNFYPQTHILEWPHLNKLSSRCCDELDIFGKEISGSSEIYEEENMLGSKYPLLPQDKVLLPKLEILDLSYLNSLIPLIWDDQLLHNSFNNLKKLMVKTSGFVKLVPLHVLKSLNNLEEVNVGNCDMLETVFDFEDLNYEEMESSSVVIPLKKLIVWNLPKLKNVWSDHYQGNMSFPSLRSVYVSECESLTSIFPASIAKGMLCDLEELQIRQCGVDVIVAKDQVSESVDVTFGFPKLTSLLLYGLPYLRNFYPKKHTLEWPQLNKLSVCCCDELKIFEKEVSGSSEIYEEENMLDSKYPLLPHGKVIGNLKTLILQGEEVKKIDQFRMYHFPKLKQLHLSLEKEPSFRFWERSSNSGELKLSGDFEKALGGDNVAALTARFPELTLEKISIMESLSPSFVSSPNLTHLKVNSCFELTTLMTSSIARSLVHLMHLSISNCDQIEEIITNQKEEDDEVKEIFFNKMKFLKLDNLQELKRFCGYNYTFKFLLLDQLIIKECPKFKTFSPGLIETPSLKSVQLWEDWEKHQEIWDTDLNKTVYRQQFVASRKLVLDEDDAIMIRNDQFPVDCCPQVKILQIEGFVEEWVTFPYTLLGRFPKLNALHVENCSFEEIFPSHAPTSTSFHNLTVLKVSRCHQLVYLVTCSTVKSLVNLETLEIDNCEKLKEIVRNETNEDVEWGITFNELRILKLTRLPKLKTQEDKKDFNIEDRPTNTRCSNISRSIFSYNKVLLQKLETLELSYLSNNLISLIWDDQLLHNSFSNLKTLILQGCGFMKTVPLRVLKYLNNLEKLEVSFCELEMVFGFEDLNDYHKEMESSSVVVPLNLKHLEVKKCCGLTTLMTSLVARSLVHITHISISECYQIEEIIKKHEGEDDEDSEIIFNQMKFLKVDDLPRLKRFCGYNYTFIFPLLEHVTVIECPRLTMFCPGVIHAPQLQSVGVHIDETHKDIWMTNLNNTIQHLFTFEEVISTCRSMSLNSKNITMIMDVFPKVSSLYVESFTDERVTFPYSSLEKFPKLDELNVEHCSFEEIFPSQDQIIDFMGKIPPFETLDISYMDKLKSIWKDDSQLPPIHQNLRYLCIKSCCSLVKLAPSSPSFKNLIQLFVFGCHQLIHLVTTSTAKSLVSLRWLQINDCKRMEEIVMNDTNEDVQGGITFNELYGIKLTDMPSLKMFSSQSHTFKFPELEKIKITGCPEIKMFCRGVLETPRLSKVKIEEDDMKWKDEGDLNKTIEMLSPAKGSINI